jgi:hypothetical protein
MSNSHFLKMVRIGIFTAVAAGMILALGTTIGGTITQQAQAAKGGVDNFFCYPYTFGEEGSPETEWTCFTNMGECRKEQAVAPDAAGSCFHWPK